MCNCVKVIYFKGLLLHLERPLEVKCERRISKDTLLNEREKVKRVHDKYSVGD